MRALFAIALFALDIAGLTAARAADLPAGPLPATHIAAAGVRVTPIVIFDYEPGVLVRAYWRAPWRHRHYFPVTGKRPKVGRHERMSAVRPAPKPAQTFYREWSNAPAYEAPPPQPPLK